MITVRWFANDAAMHLSRFWFWHRPVAVRIGNEVAQAREEHWSGPLLEVELPTMIQTLPQGDARRLALAELFLQLGCD